MTCSKSPRKTMICYEVPQPLLQVFPRDEKKQCYTALTSECDGYFNHLIEVLTCPNLNDAKKNYYCHII